MRNPFIRWTLLILVLALTLPLPGTAQGADRLALQERDDWAGVYFKGRKLGFTHARITLEGKETVVHTQVYFRLSAGGVEQTTIITQKTYLDAALRLRRFTLLQEIMGNRQKVEGKVTGGRLAYRVATRGYDKGKSMEFPADVYPASTVWLNLLDRGLAVGQSGRVKIFIEPFQRIVPMDYRILRKEPIEGNGGVRDVFVIEQKFAGMVSTLWVTGEGTILRENTAHGFESRHEVEAAARDLGTQPMSVSSFITLSLVPIRPPINSPQTLDELELRIFNLPRADALPQDHRQTLLKVYPEPDNTYTARVRIRTEAENPPAGLRRPVQASLDNAEYLEEVPEIQARHGMIRALAAEIVKDEPDAWRAALAINRWVYTNLEKVLVDSFTALDALHSRRGECQSHTNLFTALARAAGIPAKVVNGLVYSRKYQGFLYHAWPEVYVGQWRSLDPTLGQAPADATHIKLSEGNYDGALKLMEFIGQIGIKLAEK